MNIPVNFNPISLGDLCRSFRQLGAWLTGDNLGGSVTVQNESGSVSVDNVTTIRFINCTVEDNGNGAVTVIADVGTPPVLDVLTADMTSHTAPSGTVYAIAEEASFPAWQAFDQDNATAWQVPGHVDKWIAYIFGSAVTVQKLAIRARTNAGSNEHLYAPGHLRLEGSNDGTTWTTLLTVMGLSWSSGERKIWTAGSPGSYSYTRYRVFVVSTQGGGTGDKCAIAEIEFLG